MRKILKCQKGNAYPLTIMICLSVILIITVVCEYFRLIIIAEGIRDSVQDAVISTVTENYAGVYHTSREGYSAGYVPVADSFAECINYGDIYRKLEDLHDLSENNNTYEKLRDDGTIEFTIYDLSVEVQNGSIRDSDATFEITSYITLEVPIIFCGELLPNMVINLKTSAGYIPIF